MSKPWSKLLLAFYILLSCSPQSLSNSILTQFVMSKAQSAWLPTVPETPAANTHIIQEELLDSSRALGLPKPRPASKRKKLKSQKQKLKGPGYGFFYGSCDAGLKPGTNNQRQMAWERNNNDKHLKRNIKKIK